MARTREFDEDLAIHRAMQLFWRKGYEAATLPDLLKAMQLSRGSFYNAFGTKRDVLLKAIQRYMESGMNGILTPLVATNAGRAEIEKAFAQLVDYTASPKGRQGCLIVNSLTGPAAHDPEVRAALIRARAQSEDLLTSVVATGQAAGTIASRQDPRAVARFLLNAISGLLVASKTAPGRPVLNEIVAMALRVLD